MTGIKYLNSILTVLAVLLALNLWTSWATGPAAQTLAPQQALAQEHGIPNAAMQRKDMIDLLKNLNVEVAGLKTLLTSGQARVRLEAGSDE